jgi:hypothetical protein
MIVVWASGVFKLHWNLRFLGALYIVIVCFSQPSKIHKKKKTGRNNWKEITLTNFKTHKAMCVWFYVSGPAYAPILVTQLTYMTNGKCIGHRFFNIVKILSTKFQHPSTIKCTVLKIKFVLCWECAHLDFRTPRDPKHGINYARPKGFLQIIRKNDQSPKIFMQFANKYLKSAFSCINL